MKLYNVAYSGNSYKVRLLLLAHLGIPCEIIEVDILNGESRTQEFLKINPNGRTPVLDDNGFVLAESDAILAYLAKDTNYLPDDRKKFALIFQWMFFEQYSHEPFIATSRFWLQHKPDSPEKTALLASKRDGGWAVLKIMDEHLAKNDFFVGGYSIADIALFAYTHVAHEGGFLLDDFPKIRAQIERVKVQPRFVPMDGIIPVQEIGNKISASLATILAKAQRIWNPGIYAGAYGIRPIYPDAVLIGLTSIRERLSAGR